MLLSNWWRQGGPEDAVGPPAQDGGSQTSWLGGGAGSSLAGGRLVVCFLTETASRAGNQREGTRRPDRHRALQRAPPALPAGLCPPPHLLLQPGTSSWSPLWTCHSQLTEELTYAPTMGSQHPSILGAHFPACRRSPNLPCPPESLTPLLPEGSPSSWGPHPEGAFPRRPPEQEVLEDGGTGVGAGRGQGVGGHVWVGPVRGAWPAQKPHTHPVEAAQVLHPVFVPVLVVVDDSMLLVHAAGLERTEALRWHPGKGTQGK